MSFRFSVTFLLLGASLVTAAGCGESEGSTLAGGGRDANPDARARVRAGLHAEVSEPEEREALDRATPTTLFERLDRYAEALARTPFVEGDVLADGPLADLDYDQYRSIQFRPGAGIWHDEARFQVDLFHLGLNYRRPVRLHRVEGGEVSDVRFDPELFDYFGTAEPLRERLPPDLGFAGFRLHFPLNTRDGKDEIAVFLGDSYFRLLGPGQVHGLSARGLAVDVAAETGEEFPAFREFWLLRPEPDSDSLTFFGLLDSESLTGAYRFRIAADRSTEMTVEARLHARHHVGKLGVAPLTSMFLFDPNRAGAFDDFRPRVHDSDGLLMQTASGEWIWRPLSNGGALRVTSLRDVNPQGFGLAQRERDFDDFLDIEAQYHRRPSLWVEVLGEWGMGGVELVEIPSSSEFADNIVAYWSPDEPFDAGETRQYRYRLTTFDRRLDAQTLAQVERTRVGWNALPGEADPPPRTERRFVVDFEHTTAAPSSSAPPVTAVLETTAGEYHDVVVSPLPGGVGWRASFVLVPDPGAPSDMRLYLEAMGRRASETWSYVWYPDAVDPRP